MSIQEVRDVLIIAYLCLGIVLSLVVLVAVFFLVRGMLRLMGIARRTLTSVEELTTMVTERVAKPFATSASVGRKLGGVLGFMAGFRTHREKRRNR